MTFQEFMTTEILASFFTLTFLEIVLAGDNLVLIAILSGKLPEHQRKAARRFGLILAVVTRLALLVTLFWLSHLETPIAFNLPGIGEVKVTPRELVLGLGGFFLVWKSLSEISALFSEGHLKKPEVTARPWSHTFFFVILQIAIFDIVFSLDSVIAAIGLAQHVEVMAAAIITAALVMFFLVNPISNLIDRFMVIRLIALNFLALIGTLLVVEAFGYEVPHIYFYQALAVAIVVQIIALVVRSWSAGTRTAAFSFALVALVAVAAGIVYLSQNPEAAARFNAATNEFVTDVQALTTRVTDWARSLLPAK
jgi:predicted tellurium resistance membrane protein TerC